MKHHSILTTVFPRLPFAKRKLSDLEGHFLPDDRKEGYFHAKPCSGAIWWSETENRATHVFVRDFLPSITLELAGAQAGDPEPKNVRCHLSYVELPKDDALLVAARGNPIVQISLRTLDHHGAILELAENTPFPTEDTAGGDADRGLLYAWLWTMLWNPAVATIDFQIMIVVPIAHNTERENHLQKAEAAALRREHVARELTTGYRRYVSLLLVLISTAANENHRRNGRQLPAPMQNIWPSCHVVHENARIPQNDLHSTKEDAWRLLCTFHTIEVAAKTANSSKPRKDSSHYVLSLQEFVSSLASVVSPNDTGDVTAADIIEELYTSKSVKREIGLRKTLEYYIYEALPNLPG